MRSPLITCKMAAAGVRRFGSGARRMQFEELTAGADGSQLEFMKERIIQVDTRDQVVGPISKKDGAWRLEGEQSATADYL